MVGVFKQDAKAVAEVGHGFVLLKLRGYPPIAKGCRTV